MQTVTSADGSRIAFELSGAGPPLVFVHGGWDDHTAWRLVLPMLAQRFTIYAMDRRGCGQSDPYLADVPPCGRRPRRPDRLARVRPLSLRS
jgi:pimeloyl-ACP methyl ester carboxylesterase